MALFNVINLASALFNGIILAHYSWHYSTVLSMALLGIIGTHYYTTLFHGIMLRHYSMALFNVIISSPLFNSIILAHYYWHYSMHYSIRHYSTA